MTWIFLATVAAFITSAWLIADMDIHASVHRDAKFEHRHDYKPIGYGGAGWSLYRCACGAEEIDA